MLPLSEYNQPVGKMGVDFLLDFLRFQLSSIEVLLDLIEIQVIELIQIQPRQHKIMIHQISTLA